MSEPEKQELAQEVVAYLEALRDMRSGIQNSTIEQLRYQTECSLRAIKNNDEKTVSHTMARMTDEDVARFWNLLADMNSKEAAELLNEVHNR